MRSERPLSELSERVLLAMRELGGSHTPNQIGHVAGAKQVYGSGHGSGRGSGWRAFGAAQQIIPVLNGLRKRGLIDFGPRPDGLSGTAYALTDAGLKKARELQNQHNQGGET